MTIIYDMANGNIQSETAMESRCPDETTVAGPVMELRLATVDTRRTPHEHDNPQTAVHIIRALLSSD